MAGGFGLCGVPFELISVNRIVEVVKGMKPIEKRTMRARNASEGIR
jgi:hypothetical protein